MEIRESPREELPVQLLEIPESPPKLWLRGTTTPGTKLLVVVGSRTLVALELRGMVKEEFNLRRHT